MNRVLLKLRRQGLAEAASGFSLIEILIVITLIGLIGTFAITNFMGKLSEGKYKGTKIIMKQLQAALDDYYRSCNNYPTDAQGGLQALITKPTSPPECKGYDPNGYLKDKKVPKDAWDRDFFYACDDGRKYTLKSLGEDAREGGDGYNKDLSTEDPDF